MSAGPVLSCRGLRKSYGPRLVVDGVSFDVEAGEVYGLVGPNGTGKTTTISMICGLVRPDDGEVRVAGSVVDRRNHAARRAIGLVPQELAVWPTMTGRANLRFFGRLHGLRGDALRRAVEAALGLVGLADRADDRVEVLSIGMRRRLSIACGLLHSPALLVLDEPTVGVDPHSRMAIFDGVRALAAAGAAVLFASHVMSEVERLCDRVGIIDGGRLIAEGTVSQLVRGVGERSLVVLTVRAGAEDLAMACREVDGVELVGVVGDEVHVAAADATALLPDLIVAAGRARVHVSGARVAEPDLESAFLSLTGTDVPATPLSVAR